MKEKRPSKLSKVLDFLYSEEPADPATLRKVLNEAGVNMNKIDSSVSDALSKAERALKRQSFESAKVARANFEQKLKEKSSNLLGFSTKSDLLSAILGGQLGTQLQVQFRNRNSKELSDQDIEALLQDKQILELLRGIKKK